MLEEKLIIELTNESCRDFFNNILELFKDKKEFLLSLELDYKNTPLWDFLEIDFVNIPYFLKQKDTKRTYIQLRNHPGIDKKRTIAFTFYTKPIASDSELIEVIKIFENRILNRYNKKYKKKYKLSKEIFKLSSKVKEAYDEYIKALKRGANKSDRIKFYLFIMACHRYRSKINEVTFRKMIEKENIPNIEDECKRFFNCFEFYKFIKNSI